MLEFIKTFAYGLAGIAVIAFSFIAFAIITKYISVITKLDAHLVIVYALGISFLFALIFLLGEIIRIAIDP